MRRCGICCILWIILDLSVSVFFLGISSLSFVSFSRTNPGERWRALLQSPGVWTYCSFHTAPDGDEVSLSLFSFLFLFLLHTFASLFLPPSSFVSTFPPPSHFCPQGIHDPESSRRNRKYRQHQHIRGITRSTGVAADASWEHEEWGRKREIESIKEAEQEKNELYYVNLCAQILGLAIFYDVAVL